MLAVNHHTLTQYRQIEVKTMPKPKILTDRNLREVVSHGTARFPFGYYIEDIQQFENGLVSSHWHKEFEFATVRQGQAQISIGTMTFPVQQGDGIFVNTGVMHAFQSQETTILPNILFDARMIAPEQTDIYEHFVAPFLQSGISHLVLHRSVPWQAQMLDMLEEIYFLCDREEKRNELEIHIRICQIWMLLAEHRAEMISDRQTGFTMQAQVRLQQMVQFIDREYAGSITLQAIANAACISKSEALRCFRVGMHCAPIQYVVAVRLERARSLLLTTLEPVTEIAFQVGFDNCSYFDRAFKKKYGMTSGQMRRQTGGAYGTANSL